MKLAIRIAACLIALAVIGIAAAWLLLDDLVKREIESAGPAVLRAPLMIANVKLSPLSGRGEVQGLLLGNPEGFKSEALLRMERADIRLNPASFLRDEIVIDSIHLISPQVTYEAGLRSSNLSALLDNIAKTEAEQAGKPAKGKTVLIKELLITGGEARIAVSLLGGQGLPMKLPDIRLTDLGREGSGLSETQVTKIVIGAIAKTSVGVVTGAMHSAAGAIEMTGDQALETVRDLTGKSLDAGKGAAGALMKGLKGVGDLLGK